MHPALDRSNVTHAQRNALGLAVSTNAGQEDVVKRMEAVAGFIVGHGWGWG